MHHKKYLGFCSFLFLLVSLSLMFIIYGCGSNPTGGGSSGGGGGASLNKGTISGQVTHMQLHNMTITPLAGVSIHVNPSTTTDASGDFTLTGLQSGEVQMTATKEMSFAANWCCGISVLTDRDTANFDFFEDDPYTTGTARITWEIIGAQAGATPEVSEVILLSGKQMDYSSNFSYYSATHTYELDNVPDNDTCYIFIDYLNNAGFHEYAYNKINTLPSTDHKMDITFNTHTIEVTGISDMPAGYRLKMIGPEILVNNKWQAGVGYEKTAPCSMKGVPVLQGDDSYHLFIEITNEAGGKIWTTCPFTATPSLLNMPAVTFITPESTYTTLPTFEWVITGEADYVAIQLGKTIGPDVKEFWMYAPANKGKMQFPQSAAAFWLTHGDLDSVTFYVSKFSSGYPGAVNDTYLLNLQRHPENFVKYKKYMSPDYSFTWDG